MTASWPTTVRVFVNKVDLVDIVVASDVNTAYDEIAAIETTLGLGLLTSSWTGAFSQVGSSTTLKARLDNIERGVVGDAHTQYLKNTGGGTISGSVATTPSLTIQPASAIGGNALEIRDFGGTLKAALTRNGDFNANSLTTSNSLYANNVTFGEFYNIGGGNYSALTGSWVRLSAQDTYVGGSGATVHLGVDTYGGIGTVFADGFSAAPGGTVYNYVYRRTSDARLFIGGGVASSRVTKRNIKRLTTSELFDAVKPVTFQYKKKFAVEGLDAERLRFGFIAEDLEEAGLGNVVDYDPDGAAVDVDTRQLVALLWAEVKSLKAEVRALKTV